MIKFPKKKAGERAANTSKMEAGNTGVVLCDGDHVLMMFDGSLVSLDGQGSWSTGCHNFGVRICDFILTEK